MPLTHPWRSQVGEGMTSGIAICQPSYSILWVWPLSLMFWYWKALLLLTFICCSRKVWATSYIFKLYLNNFPRFGFGWLHSVSQTWACSSVARSDLCRVSCSHTATGRGAEFDTFALYCGMWFDWHSCRVLFPTTQLTCEVFLSCIITEVAAVLFLKNIPACILWKLVLLFSPSCRTLSCWFLRSLPRPTAECASCSLSSDALKTSTVCGGQRWKEAAFMLKSLRELCLRAAKTGQETNTMPLNGRERKYEQWSDLLMLNISQKVNWSVDLT